MCGCTHINHTPKTGNGLNWPFIPMSCLAYLKMSYLMMIPVLYDRNLNLELLIKIVLY